MSGGTRDKMLLFRRVFGQRWPGGKSVRGQTPRPDALSALYLSRPWYRPMMTIRRSPDFSATIYNSCHYVKWCNLYYFSFDSGSHFSFLDPPGAVLSPELYLSWSWSGPSCPCPFG